MKKKTKITVVGSGYVGMSLAALLAKDNEVTVLDIDPIKVKKINNFKSTIEDRDIELYLKKKGLSLSATLDPTEAYKGSDFIIIATPTNYDVKSNAFDTSSVDSVVEEALILNEKALIVIKSTIPVGHTAKLQKSFSTDRLIFSPEFLREGNALKDNLFPSRIIVGGVNKNAAEDFALLLEKAAEKENVEKL